METKQWCKREGVVKGGRSREARCGREGSEVRVYVQREGGCSLACPLISFSFFASGGARVEADPFFLAHVFFGEHWAAARAWRRGPQVALPDIATPATAVFFWCVFGVCLGFPFWVW